MKTSLQLHAFILLAAATSLSGQTYEYDAVGRLTRAAYADGAGVRYQYDEADNLVSVLPLTLPAAPGGLQVTRDAPDQATLQWLDQSGNETGFTVERKAGDGYDWKVVATHPAGATAYTDTGLDPSIAYAYRIQALGAAGSSAYSGSQVAPFLQAARLANISNRAQVGTGDDILIPGFVIEGTTAKQMLIRAVGPTLADFGVAGVLEDPILRVFNDTQEIASNDDWGLAADPAELAAAFVATGAFGLPPDSKDAAVLVTLQPGVYTAQVSGVGNTTGVAIVEVYDTEPENAASRLVNISGRAQVGTGGDILIPGFVVGGATDRQFLIRAVGPTLAGFGVEGTLQDPTLTLFQGSTQIAANDNWGSAPNAAAIQAAATAIGAFHLLGGSADAALLITLQPGAYTVQVSGVGNTTGVTLVEVYEVQ